MPQFPQSFLDELSARSDLAEIARGYVQLVHKGGRYWGCCPFHSEKTPSFSIHDELFYCFGCKKGGNVFHFIMEVESLSFVDAVQFLAKRAGMELPAAGGNQAVYRQRQRILALNREAAHFYHDLLRQPEGQPVRTYLQQRKISLQTAVKFGLGASLDAWDVLLNAMQRKGYEKQELLDAGLIVASQKGGFYDRFRNRLILPVVDARGDVVAFGGRVLNHAEPKYMNSPETMVYSKRRVLYGLNLARRSKRSEIIICEGNLDVITLHQAGFDNAVASMGTALTIEQLRLLEHRTKQLVLCYDNDSAGQKATERALEILRNTNFSVKVLELPRRRDQAGNLVKQDADDFIKFHGANAFAYLLYNSASGMDFRMAQIAGKYDLSQDEARVAYCNEVSALLAESSNAVERDVYTIRAAQTAGISPEAMKLEVQKALRQRMTRQRRTEQRKNMNPAVQRQPSERALQYQNIGSAMAEEGLIRLFLLDESLFPRDAPPVNPDEFSSAFLCKIFMLLWQARQAGEKADVNALTQELTSEEISIVVSFCQKPVSHEEQKRQAALRDYIQVIKCAADQRAAAQTDPLLASMKRNMYKKRGTGGKRNDE